MGEFGAAVGRDIARRTAEAGKPEGRNSAPSDLAAGHDIAATSAAVS